MKVDLIRVMMTKICDLQTFLVCDQKRCLNPWSTQELLFCKEKIQMKKLHLTKTLYLKGPNINLNHLKN
jgi:hypothetical protein